MARIATNEKTLKSSLLRISFSPQTLICILEKGEANLDDFRAAAPPFQRSYH
jgi:hypothetical protein